jgi:peptidoglycan/LPS O-acetylase OafA/YrhL
MVAGPSRRIVHGLALACWVAVIACFVAGNWLGRPALASMVPSLVVIYIVTAARLRRTQPSR